MQTFFKTIDNFIFEKACLLYFENEVNTFFLQLNSLNVYV